LDTRVTRFTMQVYRRDNIDCELITFLNEQNLGDFCISIKNGAEQFDQNYIDSVFDKLLEEYEDQ